MKKYLLSGLLAITTILSTNATALAAPGIAYKKQLSTPTVPASVLAQVTKIKNPKFETILNQEKDCSDVIYRLWNTRVTNEGDKAATIIEARTNKNVMWKVLPSGGKINTHQLYSCHDRDLILSERGDYFRLRCVRYSAFKNSGEWTSAKNTIEYNPLFAIALAFNGSSALSVDGIDQMPGILTVAKGEVTGDSRPITFDQKTAFHQHTLPHYRDLTKISDEETVVALFFRTSDGYAVVETSVYDNADRKINSEEAISDEPKVTFYQIHNGEAHYSIVDELPASASSYVDQSNTGYTLSTWYSDKITDRKTILIHGLPHSAKESSHVKYEARGSIVWETDAQVYTRYMITETKTGAQQYWEATVNKQ